MIGTEGKELERLNELVSYYKDAFTEHVFIITSENNLPITDKDLRFSKKTTNVLSPIFYVIPFQVLSALLCEDVGIDTRVSPVTKRYVSGHLR